MRFKNIFMYAAALSMLALSGCAEKTDPSEIDSATRIALSKDIPVFTASGNTEDGEDAYRAIVTIVQGDKINGIGWDYSLDDPKQCAEVVSRMSPRTSSELTKVIPGPTQGKD